MELSKLPIKAAKRSRVIDPQEIFKGLTLRGTVENLWEPQAEALRDWHKQRASSDAIVEMNTGGGKTLVGLLIGQSLANETQGKILLVCATNQLVEQTAHRAHECGIRVATYMKSTWANKDAYDSCSGACLTNYAAVFNGLSIFRNESIKGLIFDDAHVANNAIRGQFTLRVPQSDGMFNKVANLFRGYFARTNRSQMFEEALQGNKLALLFVPAFELRRNVGLLSKTLIDGGVAGTPKTKFAWAHLKDKLLYCTAIISGAGIEITPPVLPTFATTYFGQDLRRVYLTATLPSQVEFVRTFGVSSVQRITPGGKSGEAQKQIIFGPGETDEEQRKNALHLAQHLKACIIAPSSKAAEDWPSTIPRFDGEQGQSIIDQFRSAKVPEKLLLIARYDGIDLPGDACRVLILDGVPTGSSLIDRFMDEGLRIERLRASHTATRIVQAIGRIFRSNTDHGAVLVCGAELQSWLRDPNNLRLLPKLLQQQILLGHELRRMVDESKATFQDLLDAVLRGRSDWDELYSSNISEFETTIQVEESRWFVEMVERERTAFSKLWVTNAPLGAKHYSALAADAASHESRLAAWYRHWLGLAQELAGEDLLAAQAYVEAANERAELGRPEVKSGTVVSSTVTPPGFQAKRVAGEFAKNRGKLLKRLEATIANLQYGPETNPTEQALSDLGELLGLSATRPDNTTGTGPDVLWRLPEQKAGAALDAKTNKQSTSQYQKKEDIGQFHDHIEWVEKNFPGERFSKALVGYKLQVSKEANPAADLKVITLEQFINLAHRLEEALRFLESTAHENELEVCSERALQHFGLLWPACIESLESSLAIDLKNVGHAATPESD